MSRFSLGGKVVLATVAAAILLITGDAVYYRSRIHPGVSLGEFSLGGMTLEEAAIFLEENVWTLDSIHLAGVEETPLSMPLEQLGITWDRQGTLQELFRTTRGWQGRQKRMSLWLTGKAIPACGRVLIDESRLAACMEELVEKYVRSPREASFQVTGSRVDILPEETGRYLKISELRRNLLAFFTSPSREATIELPVGDWPSGRTAEDLAALNVQEVMVSFSTEVAAGNPDRLNNIRLGTEVINGFLLAPGEEFSFNRVVGPSTREKGYREAPIIVGEELVPGLGGGLCQVSSTLYNAVLLANLPVTERVNHSMTVAYLPLGRDAAVSYGSLDFKFVNNRDHYLLIGGHLENYRLTFYIFGPPMQEKVELVSEGYRRVEAPVREIVDQYMKPGQRQLLREGRPGFYISTWRVLYRDGKEVGREKLSTDYYPPAAYIYRVGPKPAEEAPAATPDPEGEPPAPP